MTQQRYTRDPSAMWNAVRKLKRFTRTELLRAMKINRDDNTIAPFLNKLIAGGYVEVRKQSVSGGRKQAPAEYELVRDAGIHCPRLDKDGKKLPPSERQRMWSGIKVIGRGTFDWRDLTLIAKTGVYATKEFCWFLVHAGYLKVVQQAKPGLPAKYSLIRARDTGPIAPEIRAKRTEVYDPNTQEVVWKKGHVRALDAKTGKTVWVKGGEL